MKPLRLLLPLAAAAVALAGCGSSGVSHGPVRASGGPSAAVVTVDEHANGSTVHLPVGGSLLLVLHSRLWPFPQNSAPALLEQVGRPMPVATGSCPPGGGCGAVTTRYLARQTGTVVLTDHRDSCGEAMRCRPGQGDFRLTVVVGAGG